MQFITLGIGTPADIAHFILVGLSPEVTAVLFPDDICSTTVTTDMPGYTQTLDDQDRTVTRDC